MIHLVCLLQVPQQDSFSPCPSCWPRFQRVSWERGRLAAGDQYICTEWCWSHATVSSSWRVFREDGVQNGWKWWGWCFGEQNAQNLHYIVYLSAFKVSWCIVQEFRSVYSMWRMSVVSISECLMASMILNSECYTFGCLLVLLSIGDGAKRFQCWILDWGIQILVQTLILKGGGFSAAHAARVKYSFTWSVGKTLLDTEVSNMLHTILYLALCLLCVDKSMWAAARERWHAIQTSAWNQPMWP